METAVWAHNNRKLNRNPGFFLTIQKIVGINSIYSIYWSSASKTVAIYQFDKIILKSNWLIERYFPLLLWFGFNRQDSQHCFSIHQMNVYAAVYLTLFCSGFFSKKKSLMASALKRNWIKLKKTQYSMKSMPLLFAWFLCRCYEICGY